MYNLQDWKPAVVVEVMLPKKLEYFSKIQEVLETPFSYEQIQRLPILEDWEERGDEGFVTWLANIIHGYSIYEVDGRFRQPGAAKLTDERTLIIRFIIPEETARLAFGKEPGKRTADEDCTELILDVVRLLIAERFANELGTEDQIWVLAYGNPRLSVFKRNV